ncbi:type I toxin-antitoxin system Fst family toxin [Enterococcus italicus]|nr:type I toxin-antitoxin system Fst family toxin [Enterococcus italicus]EAF0599875.1 type I toxin-antitoxin system Fst family toxin [Listeria monocytogenes]
MLNNLLTLVIAPVFTGIVIELFSYWLNKKDDN